LRLNDALTILSNAYLDGGTGSIMLYYSLDNQSTGVSGSIPFTGTVLNSSPSSTVGEYNGLVLSATGATTASASSSLSDLILDNDSGIDLRSTSVKFGPFSGKGFLNPNDYDSELTMLFSFEKKKGDHGVLFGSLYKEDFNNGEISFSYGRGFNIGINDRNQLFFQGIDSERGPYVLTANELELANKNICSARVSPYEVAFSYYNLADDSVKEQYLRTDCKIQNPEWSEPFYLGTSPHYIKSGNTFSGCLDQFLMISGSPTSSDLKSLSSGFVATGDSSLNQSYTDTYITGHEIQLIAATGITGYQAVITGYTMVRTETDLIEFVLVETATPIVEEGYRFITGYTLPNNSGTYLEETSFLIENDLYQPSGNDAFATLGLTANSGIISQYEMITNKVVTFQTGLPLYNFLPITGIIVDQPSGYLKINLTGSIIRTGEMLNTLTFKSGILSSYQNDYLYYLGKRLSLITQEPSVDTFNIITFNGNTILTFNGDNIVQL
jgi:hypothetical protein